jgi:hypothetical protein
MPFLTSTINPYVWCYVIEDPDPKQKRVFINNVALNIETLQPIATYDMGIPQFNFQPVSTSQTSPDEFYTTATPGNNWYDWPVVLTTGKHGLSHSDSRATWPSRIGSWDPWILFLDYNAVNGRAFYNKLTDFNYIFWPRDLVGEPTSLRNDVWIGYDLARSAAQRLINTTTASTTTGTDGWFIPAILRDDNQWIVLDQNYYGTGIVWANLSGSAPTFNLITRNDRLQHFVLGQDDYGRAWFLEVHGNDHNYTVQVVGMNSLTQGTTTLNQISQTLLSNVTGGYTRVINQFPSNFKPGNSKRRVFYSSHYSGVGNAAVLQPRRFVWQQDTGNISYSVCNMIYNESGASFSSYGQVCTDSTTNYNEYGINSWFIKPHVFYKNGKHYITFCNVEKSLAVYRTERWNANAKQRTWLTYEIGDGENDDQLTFHSVINWSTIDDLPKMFMPLNTDGDKMLVFQIGRVVELAFTTTQGWTVKNTVNLDVRAYGQDSTGRIYLVDRSGSPAWWWTTNADSVIHSGYNNIYTYDSNLPHNIEVTYDQVEYNYTGNPISANCVVNTNNKHLMRIHGASIAVPFSPFNSIDSSSYSLSTSTAVGVAGRVSTPNYEGYNFRTGDFCVEFWMYNMVPFSSQTNLCGIIGHKTNNDYYGWQIWRNGDSKLALRLSRGTPGTTGITFDFKSNTDVGTGVWEHWALVRQSGALKWYRNGVLDGQVASDHDIYDYYALLWLGFNNTNSIYYSGFLNNVRVVKGNCVYTGDFTPPTGDLTAVQSSGPNINAITVGQCSLLTCQKADIYDAANLVDTSLILKICGVDGEIPGATFSDGSTKKQISTINGTATIPIVINSDAPASIACFSIIPLTWVTPTGAITAGASEEAYSFQLDVEGDDGAVYSITAGSLPPGLTLNSSTGLISGIPVNEQPTTYTFSVTVANTTESQTRNFTLYCSLQRPIVTSISYPQAENNIFIFDTVGNEIFGINGQNFREGAQVRINGSPVTTTYIGDTLLQIISPALTSGNHNLTVYNTDNVLSTVFSIQYSSLPSFLTDTYLSPVLEGLNCDIPIIATSDSALTWEILNSNLPGSCSFNTTTQRITGNPGMVGTSAQYSLQLKITDTENQSIVKSYIFATYRVGSVGQQQWTTPGTYTWTCPVNITSVSALAIGAGGSGGNGVQSHYTNGNGGGGGGLGWKNNIPVTPGQTYTIVVGEGANNGNSGGNSYFISLATVAGYGGSGGSTRTGGTYVGDGGGNGGNGGLGGGAGGGGAGGYTGTGGYGGRGDYLSNTPLQSGGNGTAGGGGGGGAAFNSYGNGNGINAGGGGGGTGIYGPSSDGIGAVMVYDSFFGGVGYGGGGGSGGTNGEAGSGNFYYLDPDPGGSGGNYGGGGGAPYYSGSSQGGGGAVRLIWGPNRLWPNSNTADI